FKTIGLDHPSERAASVLAFEKSFTQTYPLPEEFRRLYNERTKISKAELLSKYPDLRLRKTLARVPSSTLIRNMTPANFEWVDHAFKTQPIETLQNVYLFHS